MDVPAARGAAMPTPGKQISGFWRPSWVGPRDEKLAMASTSSVAPTVMTLRAQPGDPTVPLPGPSLPAATQTTTPRAPGGVAGGGKGIGAVGGPGRAQRQVDDLGPLVHGPLHASHDVAGEAAAVGLEHLGHDERRLGRHARVLASAGAAVTRGDAADVGAVAVAIREALPGEIPGGRHPAGQVRDGSRPRRCR